MKISKCHRCFDDHWLLYPQSSNIDMLRLFFSFAFLIMCLGNLPLFAEGVPEFYQKNIDKPRSFYEVKLITHARTSFEKSLKLESKLTGNQFAEVDASIQWRTDYIPHYHYLRDLNQIPYYHLLNNLCNLQGASHLHIGLLGGDSYIAALYGNQSSLKQQIGLDWFHECPKEVFVANCNQYLNPSTYQIIEGSCFDIDKSIFNNSIDIYFYDADHSLKGHEKALTYYDDIFSKVFIVVIDDWGCPWIRAATFKAFTKLNYRILYENAISSTGMDNGQYLAVIRK